MPALSTRRRDAGGTKLTKTVKLSNAVQYYQHYPSSTSGQASGIEYRQNPIGNAEIEAIYHSEGRVAYTAGANPKYEYSIKDHLGNTRLTFCDLNGDGAVQTPSEILQENHYYAFGLSLHGPWMNAAAPDNLYQYSGKELQPDHGLGWMDFGARMYIPEAGRWNGVDAMAEKNNSESPYIFVHNTPLIYADPDGNDGVRVITEQTKDKKTLEIKATYFVQTEKRAYYTVKGKTKYANGYSSKQVEKMQKGINKYLNKLDLNISEGEYKGYSIQFDLEFREGGTVEQSEQSAQNEKEQGYSVGNSFTKGNSALYVGFKSEEIDNGDGTVSTSTLGGITIASKDIFMNSAEDGKMNKIHEIFHTFGFSHPKSKGGGNGIMKYPPERPDQSDANQLGNGAFLPVIKSRIR